MPSPKLKIGISIWSFTPNAGGLQSHAEQLCRNLQKRGHEVVVVTRAARHKLNGNDYLFFNEPESSLTINDVTVKPLKFAKFWRPALWLISKCNVRPRLAGLGVNLYRIVSQNSALNAFSGLDIIHHIGEAAELNGFAAAAAARHWRIPFVVQPTCHPHHYGDKPMDFCLLRKASRLLAHTKYEAEYLRQNGFLCPIDVVGNGIEDRADGIPSRFRNKFGIAGPFILYVGRKDYQKGYFLLLEAYKLIRRQRPDLGLVCMGPPVLSNAGPQTDGLVDLDFVSEEEKHDALAACTCLCVPSVGESFGLVFMEAGRYAKPVIGRNVPVLRELWEDGAAGKLVGVSDDEHNIARLEPDELAAELLELLSDEDECRRLGGNLHRVSERFVWPQVVERFEASYHETLKAFRMN